jgi:hypothetical protein
VGGTARKGDLNDFATCAVAEVMLDELHRD